MRYRTKRSLESESSLEFSLEGVSLKGGLEEAEDENPTVVIQSYGTLSFSPVTEEIN